MRAVMREHSGFGGVTAAGRRNVAPLLPVICRIVAIHSAVGFMNTCRENDDADSPLRYDVT